MPEGVQHLITSVLISGKPPCHVITNIIPTLLNYYKPLAILIFSFNAEKQKHDQFIVATV